MGDKQDKPQEYKTFPFKLTKLDTEGRTLEGYASVFDTVDLGGDRVHKGAFRKTLEQRGDRVKFLWQHDATEPLGRPIEMREDDNGLFVKAIISRTRRGLDTLELLGDGAIDELSIGYDAIKGGTEKSKDDEGNEIRELKELRLYEFSLVTFAMNQDARVTDLKEDPAPSEAKPAPDVTENTIRIRVRDPGDFEDDSFRTITIGPKDQGIQATIGRLEGEDSTTVQAYIFDKEKWSAKEAQEWVDEHKKDGVPELEEKEDDVPTEEKTTELETKDINLSERVEMIHQAFNNQYNPPQGPWRHWVSTVYDEYVIVHYEDNDGSYQWFQVAYTITDDGIDFVPRGEWIEGEYTFTPNTEKAAQARVILEDFIDRANEVLNPDHAKAGRVLAARNAQRIGNALGALISVLEDAGIDIPGVGKKPEPEEEEEEENKDWSLEIETAAAELDLFELEH